MIIIGAGASGLTAAIEAARAGASVLVLEKQNRVGKKLLATGNGKCNFTNQKMEASCFRSTHPELLQQILKKGSVEETLSFFEHLGIEPVERNGYYYPASGQAASVCEVLLLEAMALEVQFQLECEASAVERAANGRLLVTVGSKKLSASSVILAAGSQAGLRPTKETTGYQLALSLGHTLTPLSPALTGLRCAQPFVKQWAGVRTEGAAALFVDGRECARDAGELQLTAYGISGIPVFQISRYAGLALQQGKQVSAQLSFTPDSKQELLAKLESRSQWMPYKTMEQLLIGMWNQKLIPVFLSLAGIAPTDHWRALSKRQKSSLATQLSQLSLTITGINPMEQAQVCAGGIPLSEVDPDTMESRCCPGLYVTGELLDADGICGGYNLQWAWVTGRLAGQQAARKHHRLITGNEGKHI